MNSGMTVGRLIEMLSRFPSESRVFAADSELSMTSQPFVVLRTPDGASAIVLVEQQAPSD